MNSCTLSIVIPCYNEEQTLRRCVAAVLQAFEQTSNLELQIIIVDDCSRDRSLEIARELAREHAQVLVQHHERNQGKGAALRTGFQHATGDFVAIQDADLEYDPHDLIRLVEPLRSGTADVVYGSRFLTAGLHRVLYFWHSLGNRFLTFLSNMFTDLNLTDMETCYKVFRRDVIQGINLQENRFGFEPEITAKLAQQRLRIYEMGVSYFGRTYAEGKKIGVRDGFRALYCIVKYNAHSAPWALQLLVYTLIGGTAALFNLALFLGLRLLTVPIMTSAVVAFAAAAVVNYLLCIWLLFRHRARWNTISELAIYLALVALLGLVDGYLTQAFIAVGIAELLAKSLASAIGLVLNFIGRRLLVFPEPHRGPWQPTKRDTGTV
ncbi:MAG: glycosyltransferase [Planctomycetota bacterium]